jgi:hypothetical protein
MTTTSTNSRSYVWLKRGLLAALLAAVAELALQASYAWLVVPRDLSVYLASTKALLLQRSPWDAATISVVAHQYGYMPAGMNAAGLWTLPMVFPFLAPFTLLPYPLAAWLWSFINLLLLWADAGLIRQWLPSLKPRTQIILLAAFPPVFALLLWGQIPGLVLFGYLAFIACAQRRRDGLAGLALTLTTFKPHLGFLALIFIAYWVVRERRWKVAAGLLLGLLVVMTLVFAFSPNWLIDYRNAVQDPPLSYDASTFFRVLHRMIFPQQPWMQFIGLVASSIGLLVYLIWRRPRSGLLPTIPFLLAWSISLAPYGWIYDQIVALPALMWLVYTAGQRHPAWFVWTLVGAGSVAYYAQVVRGWGDNNPLIFWAPLAISLLWTWQLWRERRVNVHTGGDSHDRNDHAQVVVVEDA